MLCNYEILLLVQLLCLEQSELSHGLQINNFGGTADISQGSWPVYHTCKIDRILLHCMLMIKKVLFITIALLVHISCISQLSQGKFIKQVNHWTATESSIVLARPVCVM